jgi:pentatricopeptide repeat domain-containing protein 1
MEACGNSKQWRTALELMEEMESSGIQPTEVTYSVLINALGKGGQVELALSFLRRMQKEGLEPNLYTYNAAITALAKAPKKGRSTGNVKMSTTALALLDEMKQSGFQPDGFCYSSAIACCGADGRWIEACELIETMKQGGPSTSPNKVAYTSAISEFFL